MGLFDKTYRFKARLALIKSQLIYRFGFKRFGKHSRIISPLRIAHSEHMTIEENVYIDAYGYLIANTEFNRHPEFVIKSGTKIGNFNHISCANRLVIGKNVLTADRVYISDNFHIYDNIDIPIKDQSIGSKGEVIIGDNSWIGDGVTIISCKIGKNCIIGANSVVLKDIPDYSVAVGSPARVVKKYSFEDGKWKNVERK